MASKYDSVIECVFFNNYTDNATQFTFDREELAQACAEKSFKIIKNLGDIVYSYRFRKELPIAIQDTAPEGCEWIILGAGIGKYMFKALKNSKIGPSSGRQLIKVPDATPEIIKMYAPANDEQALLTKVRYNRILDIFLGLTCYSVQNHFRTTVEGVGQIEVDEIYIGVNNAGAHFVMPCQAKSPGDKFGFTQISQDMSLCAERYPNVTCRPIAMQFLSDNSFAILELDIQNNDHLELVVVDEKHYTLVDKDSLTQQELTRYMNLSR